MEKKQVKKDKGFSTIRIRDSTKEKLADKGKKGDSFDDIILRLLKK